MGCGVWGEGGAPKASSDGEAGRVAVSAAEIEFFIDNLLVRIHFIIVMIWWNGLAPWEFELHLGPSWIFLGSDRGNGQETNVISQRI